MTKKESIQKKQLIEESHLNEFCNKKGLKNYRFTALTERYDASMKSGETFYMCEIKVRNEYDMHFFNEQGSMLERKKLEGMWERKLEIEQEKGIKIKMLYFTFATDGCLVYELSSPDDYEFSWKKLRKDNYDHELIWKQVHNLFLPIETFSY
jgi:hypothetical protein